MLTYTEVPGKSADPLVKTFIHVEGEVTAQNWEQLREICLSALKCSDQIVLDLEGVSSYDYSLGIFVCLLRRTMQLLHKRLEVQGKQQESFACVYGAAQITSTKRCSFAKVGPCCLWENLYTKTTLLSSLGDDLTGRFGGNCQCDQGVWQGCQHEQ
jgi:hypothetical protein